MVQSPLTVGILFVLIGYYLCYYGWLLWKSKHIAPEDLEAAAAPPAAAAQAQSDVTPRLARSLSNDSRPSAMRKRRAKTAAHLASERTAMTKKAAPISRTL